MSSKRSRTTKSVRTSNAKRPRVKDPPALSTANSNTGQSSFAPAIDVPLEVAIDVLTPAQQRDALLQFAEQHAPLREFICNNYKEEANRRSSIIKEFNWESKEVWKELFVLHTDSRGSKEYEAARGVIRFINKTVRSIAKEARQPSSFGTRANAISTLRKIGKSIALGEGVLGCTVIEFYSEEFANPFVESFLKLAESFSGSEKELLLKMTEKGFRFKDKLEELLGLEDNLFPGLDVALDILRGKQVDRRQGENEEDVDDSEDEDED